MRAPTRNSNTQNIGAKWLRNGVDNNNVGEDTWMTTMVNTIGGDRDKVAARFMEIDGNLTEIGGDSGAIKIVHQNQGA